MMNEALPKAREVTVRLPERAWRELVEYEPFPAGIGLAASAREQLRAGVGLTEERPARLDFRIVTLDRREAEQLEAWLTAVSRRREAPIGAGVALVAVGEGLRLAV
jgi:hypothetical protein